ncbi:MAG: 2-hydroxyacid dehydrogenase [Bacilli bacterium]|nr:2-hydroxyacid dehydrogenase [Bacilli bacterium]
MKKIAFFDAKPYDKVWFDKLFKNKYDISYYEYKLNLETAQLTKGFDVVVAFVNDDLSEKVISVLSNNGVEFIAMRCAGYNNVDVKAAYKKIHVARVPGYSPYAVAEHAFALLLSLNRKIHRAYARTRDHNFSISGLTGFDLKGKTVGVIGTGKIGQVFIDIAKGFNMNVIAYDLFPLKDRNINYVTLDELFSKSDVISLHCPLTEDTYHLIDKTNIEKMKNGVVLINTSRGALIDSEALLNSLKEGKVKAAGLDVYEEESEFFFEDFSNVIMKDEVLSALLALPNVIITSHQAFLTDEALENIATTTLENIEDFYADKPLKNEICYRCEKAGANPNCYKNMNGRCF